MFRSAWAVLAGIVAAAVIYMLANEIRELLYPPPAGLGSADAESLRRYHSQLPFAALGLIFIRSILATFIGTLAACYIGKNDNRIMGVFVGGVVLAYAIAYFIAVPFPLWLSLSTIIGIVLATMLAVYLAPVPRSTSLETDSSDSDPG